MKDLKLKLLLVCVLTLFVSAPAVFGDWDPEDGHKMHYPQLPDPCGFDVTWQFLWALGDDWQCSETGPVEDIHFWVSFEYGEGTPDDILNFDVEIWSNNPGDPCGIPWSHPDQPLWSYLQPTFTARYVDTDWQGWFDPFNWYWLNNNHIGCWQINIENIPDPFTQTEGEIYWLVISNVVTTEGVHVGWKESNDHFMDNAVWSSGASFWEELYDPENLEPMDLAFVITGEGGPADPNVKWSQPPVLWEPPDIYIGWDEPSLDPCSVMALDDFRCDSNDPVTAIRWWGSLLGWYDDYIQPGILLDAFYISIWTDTPAETSGPEVKWTQRPDLSEFGFDLDVTEEGEPWLWAGPEIAADDFNCTQTGPITDITIWGSWVWDNLPQGDPTNVWFTVSIHENNPQGPYGYSEPCEPPLWVRDFSYPEFDVSLYADMLQEGYYIPCESIYENDTMCWQYDFYIDPEEAFVQHEGEIYWLDVQAHVVANPMEPVRFGWKTSIDQWNDYAVWACGYKYDHAQWEELWHPMTYDPLDLAFEITTTPPAYSHPNEVIWDTYCETYDVNFYGWEYDPRLLTMDLPKFEFYQEIDPCDYWYQPGDSGIYWLGITALYHTHGPDFPFGWETRPHFFMDDAVRFYYDDIFPPVQGIQHPAEMFEPIEWDGESWDLSFELISKEEPCEPDLDFGDADDPPYPTLLVPSDGARHIITGNPPWLGPVGDNPDPEPDGQPDPQALGDDNDGNDDENGVTIPILTQGVLANVIIEVYEPTGIGGFVELWIDFNGNGNWTDAGELVWSGMLGSGLNAVPVTAPIGSVIGQTYARCRISTNGTGSPTGLASDGEVEDHEVTIEEEEEILYKWSQPPVEIGPGEFYGWDELSIYNWMQIVADDWPCNDQRPVTDVHWWGSYYEWTEPAPPPIFTPVGFHIGIWTDVPDPDPGDPMTWSHPGIMIWEYHATMAEVYEEYVGFDVYPGRPLDSCFKYDLQLPEEMWFWQDPNENAIYWVSIAAIYEPQPTMWPWGWKTREHFFMDDAVRIFEPTMPLPYQPFIIGEPIEDPPGTSWDMAFELTTQECLIGGNAGPLEHPDWVAWGYPKCWCYSRQCRGDINGLQTGPFWVQALDLALFRTAFNQRVLPPGGICADLNHLQTGPFRVQALDLAIFRTYFNQRVVPACDQVPIYTGPYNFWTSP